MKARLLLSLAVLAVFQLGLNAQPAAPKGPTEAQIKQEAAKLHEYLELQQKIAARQFAEFEQGIQRMISRYERSPRAEDRDKAVVLRNALEFSKNKGISLQFENIVDTLKNREFRSIQDVKKAMDTSKKVSDDIREMLALLRQDSRSKAVEEEKKRLEEIIKEIERVIHQEKILKAQTEANKTDKNELAKNQDKTQQKVEQIAKALDGKGTEAKNFKGDPKGANKNGDDSAKGKDSGNDDKRAQGKDDGNKSGDKNKDGDKGSAKGGDDKSGKSGDKSGDDKEGTAKGGDGKDKTGDMADAKGSKDGGDGKQANAKDNKGGDGKEGDGKAGDKKGGAESGQAKSGDKAGDKKGGDGKEGSAKGGDGKDKAGDMAEAKGSKDGGDGKQAGAKDNKGGMGKEGDGKAGDKKGGAESGQAKAGDKSGKAGGDKAGKPGDKAGQAKAGDSKGAEAKAGAKSSQSGSPSKGGEAKAGGQPKEGSPGQSKSGSESKGQAQAKSGQQPPQQGQQGQQGQQAQNKGDNQQGPQGPQPPQGPQDPQQEIKNNKKQVQESGYDMAKATQKIQEGKNEEATKDQEKAIDKLEKVKKKLEDLLNQIREEELEKLLAQLKARCEKMLAMQIEVRDGTLTVDQLIKKNQDKKPTRENQQASVKLADREGEIIVEADKALDLLKGEGTAVAFPEVFQQIREDMIHVQRRLNGTDVGPITVGIENDIIATLEEMIKALEKQQKELDQKKSKPGQPGQQQQQDQKLLDQIAELKMIRAMQMRVNNRTTEYGKTYTGEQAREANIVRELNNLGDRQERIFDITRKIAQENAGR